MLSYDHQHWRGCLAPSVLKNWQIKASQEQTQCPGPTETQGSRDSIFQQALFPLCSQTARDSGIQVRGTTLQVRAFEPGGRFFTTGFYSNWESSWHYPAGSWDIKHLAICGTFLYSKELCSSKCQQHPTEKHWSTGLCSYMQLCSQFDKLRGFLCVCSKSQHNWKWLFLRVGFGWK